MDRSGALLLSPPSSVDLPDPNPNPNPNEPSDPSPAYRRSAPSAASSTTASSVASPVFSVDGASSQSSVASSACSSSLDPVWDADAALLSACRDRPPSTDHRASDAFARATAGAAVTVGLCSPAPSSTSSSSSSSSSSSQTTGSVALPADQRRNRRRTGAPVACARAPPSLVRQSDRRLNFVDGLVDSAAQIVEVIWPLSNVAGCSAGALGVRGVLPLKTFIQETLRRSRTSYSTLQVALYYLIRVKHRVPKVDFTMEQPEDSPSMRALQCGRRMFLAALILASKYLQDRNYSARAWSKISGLSTHEINLNEMTFLDAIGWRLHVSEPTFQRWTDLILKYTTSAPSSPAPPTRAASWPTPSAAPLDAKKVNWTTIVARLTPDLLPRVPTRRGTSQT